MKHLVWFLVVLLVILHQDYWQWDCATLDFGFLPRALSYHVFISLAAASVWAMAIRFCWSDREAAVEIDTNAGGDEP